MQYLQHLLQLHYSSMYTCTVKTGLHLLHRITLCRVSGSGRPAAESVYRAVRYCTGRASEMESVSVTAPRTAGPSTPALSTESDLTWYWSAETRAVV